MASRIRRRSAMAVALALAVGTAGGCGTTEAGPTSGVEVSGAWARTTASGATTGVVYLTITGHQTDRLDGASVDPSIATAAELHQMVAADGTVIASSDGEGGAGSSHHDHSGGGGDDEQSPDSADGVSADQAMIMKPVTGGVAIPSGRDIVLGPGGYHIMLQELAQPLTAGRSFPLTLHFERAGDQAVEVEIRDDAP